MTAGTVLHLAPHPDDELIGAPATLMALRDAGWRIVNLACSLGAPDQADRRLAELRAASAAAGFVLEVVEEPLGGLEPAGGPDDAGRAPGAPGALGALGREVSSALARHAPALVVGPSPHDRHRGHELVGRAALDAVAAVAGAAGGGPVPRLWLWGLWADLPFPSLAVAFDEARLDEVLAALGAHAGELARNDYRRMVRGRAEMNASLGPERVFGFGSAAPGTDYVELLCEVVHRGGRWQLGPPRWLDPQEPFGHAGSGGSVPGGGPTGLDVSDWLRAPSITARFGPPGSRD